ASKATAHAPPARKRANMTNPRIIERRIVKLESVSLRLYKLHRDCRSLRHAVREFPAECCRKVATIARRGRTICPVEWTRPLADAFGHASVRTRAAGWRRRMRRPQC